MALTIINIAVFPVWQYLFRNNLKNKQKNMKNDLFLVFLLIIILFLINYLFCLQREHLELLNDHCEKIILVESVDNDSVR